MSTSKRFRADFASRLAGLEFHSLEHNPQSAFGLSPDPELTYFNPAFGVFSLENDGDGAYPLGESLVEIIKGPLRPLYQERFSMVMTTGAPWHHEYACHSPLLFREFFQSVYPLEQRSGLVVINSLKVAIPLDGCGLPALEARYRQRSGEFTQCGSCRRTLRSDGSGIWDWVPSWAAKKPARVAFSLCGTCFAFYWKERPPTERGAEVHAGALLMG